MRYLLCTIAAAVVFCAPAAAQDDSPHIKDFLTADLDRDGADDSMWYDVQDSTIVFSLSSRGWKGFVVKYPLDEEGEYLTAEEGSFSVNYSYMKSRGYYKYVYYAPDKCFRLVEYFHENYGNALSDGSGSMSLDFITRTFTADWNYYDMEADSLVSLPTVRVYVDNPVYDLGDEFDFDFVFPGYELYEDYKEAYMPEYTFTGRFEGYMYDYGDYPEIVVTTLGGETCHSIVTGISKNKFYKGDLLELTQGTRCISELGDRSWKVLNMTTNIRMVEPGPLRRCMESNQQAIDYTAAAQEDSPHIKDFLTADLDIDGVDDSMWYDTQDSTIVFSLSSRGNEPFAVKYCLEEDGSMQNYLSVDDGGGGFSVITLNMRSWEYYSYKYEPESGRFRLAEYFHENYGNAVNDGSGTMSLDLLESWFTADWNYYDMEADSLVTLPTAGVYVRNPAVYLGGDTDFAFPGYELYESYKENYYPEYSFEGVFKGFVYNYDYPEIIVVPSDGEQCSSLVAANYEELYRGDLIELTQGMHFYEEPGDGSYRAHHVTIDIELLKAGPLRRFMESNRKAIDYADDSEYTERWDANRIEAVDYYLAVGGDKQVARALRKPGVLRVFFSDFNPEAVGIDEYHKCFTAEIYNDDAGAGWDGVRSGELKPLRTLVLELYNDVEIRYWLAGDRGGKLKQLNIK